MNTSGATTSSIISQMIAFTIEAAVRSIWPSVVVGPQSKAEEDLAEELHFLVSADPTFAYSGALIFKPQLQQMATQPHSPEPMSVHMYIYTETGQIAVEVRWYCTDDKGHLTNAISNEYRTESYHPVDEAVGWLRGLFCSST